MISKQFAEKVVEWALNKDYLYSIIPHIKERVVLLSDLAAMTHLFFIGVPALQAELFASLKLDQEAIRRILHQSIAQLEKQGEWNKEAIYQTLSALSKTLGFKFKDFIAPFFIAISGQSSSAPVMDSMAVIGSDLTLARLRYALNILGLPSEQELAGWEQ